MTFMVNRLAHLALLLSGLVFAVAALDVIAEPWRVMNEAFIAEAICGHLIALVLSFLCFRSGLRFRIAPSYRTGHGNEPNV